ncbi:hypothetical protein CEXT_303881 [Caerostris extrusa]|uniref:Uncharacterized protein n=1 Tax=Caerostris extrusa TaxID=172846 RepID=A0AAV4SF89_CAEEX|nr:hypothetical protein CEXT_303881 [Caerostris extrusa]
MQQRIYYPNFFYASVFYNPLPTGGESVLITPRYEPPQTQAGFIGTTKLPPPVDTLGRRDFGRMRSKKKRKSKNPPLSRIVEKMLKEKREKSLLERAGVEDAREGEEEMHKSASYARSTDQ